MTSLFKNKYLVLLLLLIGIVSTDLLVSPMYAMKLGEEEVKEGAESDGDNRSYAGRLADGIMYTIYSLGVGQEWIRHNYSYHREGVPYKKDLHFGAPVTFAEGANQAGIFDNDKNVLKSIGCVPWRGEMVNAGATHEGGYIYKLSMDSDGNVSDVSNALSDNNLFAVFAHHTMLFKELGDDTLRNCKGHPLITSKKNERPVMARLYNKKLLKLNDRLLVFRDSRGFYSDKRGVISIANGEEIDKLPTIDFVFHPDLAVGGVLGGTAIVTLGTGLGAAKVFQLFRKKFFGEKHEDKNEGDKNTSVSTGDAGTDTVKNRETAQEQPGQQQSIQEELKVKNEAQQLKQSETIVKQETLCAEQPTSVLAGKEQSVRAIIVPERPRNARIARVALPFGKQYEFRSPRQARG